MRNLLFCLLLCLNVGLKAQDRFTNNITSYFTTLWVNLPQEKVYLHTDKPYYSAGEDIWFKAYVINASTHFPTAKSNFVYVELINSFDSVLVRVKIRKDSIGFSGNIKLKPDLASGNYLLRAYTYWMQNAGTDYFFTKTLKIGNNIDDRLFSNILFGKVVDGFLPVTLQLVDVNSKPLKDRVTKLSYTGNKKNEKPATIKSNQQGEIFWKIPFDSSQNKNKFVTMVIDEPTLKLTKQFKIPSFIDDFDVQFFPEGGTLIHNEVQTIAFKAIGSNGLSQEITGKIYDKTNEEIAEISSSYKGLGKFSLFPEIGNAYYAIIKNQKGIEKRFNLSPVEENGISIQLIQAKGKILYKILNLKDNFPHSLYLLVHSRGVLNALQKVQYSEGQISEQNLPAGIASFSVVDSIGNCYCERLYFVKNHQACNAIIESNNNNSKQRELVQLDIKLVNAYNEPLKGDYSLSITDNKLILQDSTENDIASYFLLSSDIKGYIEGPADFFKDNVLTSREKLELLMLTQAWRRYDIKKYINQEVSKPTYYLEMGQALTGKVLNFFQKPSINCDIIAISNYKNTFRTAKTDSLGLFIIDGVEFPDSTSFMVNAQKKKTVIEQEVIPDTDVFPSSKVFIPENESVSKEVFSDYMRTTKEKYYIEGGMRIINLDEITVTASAKPKVQENPMYAGADKKIGIETLEAYNAMSVLNYLGSVPGVMVTGTQISVRGSEGNPLILMDGFEIYDNSELNYLMTSEVESIYVFKGPSAAVFGMRGANGVFIITLRKDITIKSSSPVSVSVTKPLGYQKAVEFYLPKYNVPETLNDKKSDLRTTILWAPTLKMDENSNIKVEFYTADRPNNYTITIEGVSVFGDFIHKTQVLKRNNE